MTKKIVPDPPLVSPSQTTHTPVGDAANGMPALFAVQPGVDSQAALAQVSVLLRSAELNADEVFNHVNVFGSALLLAAIQSLEMARAVVDSLIGDVPARVID